MGGTFSMLLPDPTRPVPMLDGQERRWKQTVSVVWVFELAYTHQAAPRRTVAYVTHLLMLCLAPAVLFFIRH